MLLALGGCGPANERPVRGAVPGGDPAPTQPGLPPTLTPSEALRFRPLPTPSPAIITGASPSPVASPSVVAPPIVRTISPAANAHVPIGAPVTVSAVLVGRGADLATTSLSVDGADAGAAVDKRTSREWTIHSTQSLAPGPRTARVLVRDASGANGGFTWQFIVGDDEPSASPAAGPHPSPATKP
jgi:hypothetical protein